MPTMAAISGTASAPHAFCGDASSRNEKSGNLTSCLLAGGVLFRPLAIRYDVFPGHRGCDTPGVRKHRAPKGALRRHRLSGNNQRHHVRKHRAPKGALRRVSVSESTFSSFCQKAPSAKRCIKTAGLDQSRQRWDSVQKAPSAKRCIKTGLCPQCRVCCWWVRKHRAPKGALSGSSELGVGGGI